MIETTMFFCFQDVLQVILTRRAQMFIHLQWLERFSFLQKFHCFNELTKCQVKRGLRLIILLRAQSENQILTA